ncbi:MAG: hypothetical protein GXY70_05270 [Euryarchaeota archaeon]|nr:hypothetical protein [Euryarchaeota archaeon]
MKADLWEPPAGKGARALCLGGGTICEAVIDPLLDLGCRVVVVDRDRNCKVAHRCREAGIEDRLWSHAEPSLVLGDAIWTAARLMERMEVDLLVPGVPGHALARLAMVWADGRLSPRGSAAILGSLNEALSGNGTATMDPDNGTTISTLNDGTAPCPLECPQEGACPLTGRPRELDMDKVLERLIGEMSFKGSVVKPLRVAHYGVVTAEQMRDLKFMLDELEKGDAVAIATSCSCHAVMNIFKVC